MEARRGAADGRAYPVLVVAGAGDYAVSSLKLTPCGGRPEVDPVDGFEVAIEVRSRDGRPPVVVIGVVRADGTPVYGTTSEVDGIAPRRIADGRYAFALRFHDLPLLPGHYHLRAHAMDPEGMRLFDLHETPFIVGGASRELGFSRLPHQWR